jgi:hypothetical protein
MKGYGVIKVKLIKYVLDKSIYFKLDINDNIIDFEFEPKKITLEPDILKILLTMDKNKSTYNIFEKYFFVKSEHTDIVETEWFKVLFYDFTILRSFIREKEFNF